MRRFDLSTAACSFFSMGVYPQGSTTEEAYSKCGRGMSNFAQSGAFGGRYFDGGGEASLANSQPVPWHREQSLRPAFTIKKGSAGIARPVELQRLQWRTGSLTRTSPFPRHTGHILVSSALPSQKPQGFGKYADIWVIGEVCQLVLKGGEVDGFLFCHLKPLQGRTHRHHNRTGLWSARASLN